jgi:glycosyltransferase involved in cell wall biosynthesis
VRSGFPSIVSIQGIVNEIYKDKPGRMWATLRDLERQCLREGRHFIAKTPFVRAFAESQRADAVIYDIPNPVHPAFLRVERQRASGKRAIFVGSLLPEKGVEDLLAAAAQIPGLELCMIGAGSASYAAGLREQGRGMKVEWLGAVPVERVAEEMARSDVLVLPSHMETSPNVVAEAMCAGLPVVATRVGGVPAMVEHGVTGQLVAPRDDVALAQALRQTFENPDRAGAMAERARKLAKERHGADVAVRATLSAYERVLQ